MIFKRKLEYRFLPEHRWDFDGIPKTESAGKKSRRWYSKDSLERFQQLKPEGWTEESVIYEFNSLGYRSVEFEDLDTFKVCSYGCSYTFGLGIRQEDTWPEQFKQLLGAVKGEVTNFNFGLPATSADFIARMIHSSIPVINPNLVLVLFPFYGRSEYFEPDGSMRKRYPNNKLDKEYYEIWGNHHDFRNNFMKNFFFIKYFLELHNIPWLCTTCDDSITDELRTKDNYAGDFSLVENDWARDMSHPGPLSNKRIAELFFKKYTELY